jgi:glyoxylase-like metal-dependent hydrolase (beta-lactamase superfamily II)
MAVFQLPTGITRRNSAIAYRGGSFRERRDFVMTAVLVRHPRGDLLIDAGFGRQVDEHFAKMPLFFRLATPYERRPSASEQLAKAGYDRKKLRAIVLTHAHWDHVSGVQDFPETPVWVTAEEHTFITQGDALTEVARSLGPVRYEQYAFGDGPYLGFPSSYDVYDDGAIVIVPAPGHTPGSVIVFLTLPNGMRYALVGDLVWQREGILWREERPWLLRTIADWDDAGVRVQLLRMAAVTARFPQIELVPAHDARGFQNMPKL